MTRCDGSRVVCVHLADPQRKQRICKLGSAHAHTTRGQELDTLSASSRLAFSAFNSSRNASRSRAT